MTLHNVEIATTTADSSPGLRGVLGRPDGAGPWPGVVVVHEIFGIDDVMRRQVEHLAAAGYLTLMPDLFTAGGAPRCLVSTFRALRAQQGRPFADIDAGRRALLADPDCTGRIGVLGFCMGGAFALVASTRGFDVSSVNYGQLPEDLDDTLRGACPVVASYGGADRSLPGAAKAVEDSLTRLGVPHDVKEYPGAGHQFLNDAESGPLLMRPVLRIAGAGPDPVAAADAWERIGAFFAAELGAGSAAAAR